MPTLEKFRVSGQLVSIYCDPKRSTTNIQGFIEFVSTKHYVMRSVTNRGLYSGFTLRALEDIYRVEHGGDYEQQLLYLFQRREQKHPEFLPPLDVSAELNREVLVAAKRADLIVRVEIVDEECQDGWVVDIEENILTLNLVNSSGQADGQLLIEIEAISKINVDSISLQDLKLLARWHEMEPPAW